MDLAFMKPLHGEVDPYRADRSSRHEQAKNLYTNFGCVC